jgi:molybdopterin-guanine dinucleotide biosynthesis protein A
MRADPDDSHRARRCAILAGGLGTRLGGIKAEVELAGRPLISYTIAAAEAAGLMPLVVAKRSSRLPALGAELLIEPERPHHPLLGIAAALAATGEPIVVCPCDAPLLSPKLLHWLADRPDPLVVLAAGRRLQPLIGRYEPSVEPKLRTAAAAAEPATGAVSELDPRVVGDEELRRFGDPALLTLNVNTPSELNRATTALSG